MIRIFINNLKLSLLISLYVSMVVIAEASEYSFDLSAGYRTDDLDWNIASDFSGGTPNILSELAWEDLQSFQIAAAAEISRPLRQGVSTVFMGRAAYGWIVSGNNRDSDYAGDNRTLEWSRSDNDAGDGHVFDLEGGIGVRYTLRDERWQLTPNVGYSYFEQDMVMQDGYQTVSDPANAPPPFVPLGIGPFSDLNSTYLAWWFGPWLGVQAAYQYNDNLNWDFSLRWHKAEYRAEANWNLRNDLRHPVSFEHEADGDGFSINSGIEYQLGERWDFIADISYMTMQADNGIDIVYIVLPVPAVGGTRLNEVNWESWSVTFGAKYTF